MGIPKFFRWISERYPLCSDLITENRVPDFDCLYLDMNGVIHQCSHSSDEKLITHREESDIYLATFAYVQGLFDKIRPSKLVFLAVDGVAPRAKMNQQRSRRFRTAAEKAAAEDKEARKMASAKVLNDPEDSTVPVKYFDTNCITPGTEFMERLSAHLCYFIAKRVEEDPNWRNVKIIFSGPEVPGEGEHKIMEWIRAERSNPDHNPNLKHCLYGLDADLIMLGLLSHEPHFSLLREEVTFGRSKGKSSSSSSGIKAVEQVRFQLLHLGLMRDYMENEFGGLLAASLPFEYDFERILDDFVLLSLFVGNDFLPHLPHLHINENALGLLFDAYKATLPQLDGYLNDCGKISMERCAKVLGNVVEFERQVFESECADDLLLISSGKNTGNAAKNNNANSNNSSLPPITPKQRKIFDDFVQNFLKRDDVDGWVCAPELIVNHIEDRVFVAGLAKDFMLILEFTEDHSFEIRKCFEKIDEEESDDDDDDRWQFTLDTTKMISKYEKRPILSELDPEELAASIEANEEALWQSWKARYYAEKMEIRETLERDALMQKYCEGLEWVMAYYYEGVASWSWFFNYHYAPFLSDLIEFIVQGKYKGVKFELGRPFAPFEQLMGVLPSLSAALVPAPLAALMNQPDSPILHFFPTEFESDLNGKKNSWEAVVKIPFIDEALLVETLNSKYSLLSEAELKRNLFGDAFTFEYNSDSSKLTNWPAPSITFEPLIDCHVQLVKQEIPKPPRSQLRKGLTPGVLLGLEGPPSFPSLKTLPHESVLQHLDVQVFPGQASKSMTLGLVITADHVQSIMAAPVKAFNYESIHTNWPHLVEAQLVAVTDGQRVYPRDNPGAPYDLTLGMIQKYSGMTSEVKDFDQLITKIDERLLHRKGIIIAGGSSVLAVVNPFKRLRMDPGGSGAIIKEFDEDRFELVPLQLCVFNLPRVDERFQGRRAFSADPVKLVAESFQIGDDVIICSEKGGPASGFGRIDGYVQDGRALSVKLEENGNDGALFIPTGLIKNALQRDAMNFKDSREVAKELGIPPWLLSKLTSTLQISSNSHASNNNNNNFVNVGFGVKFEGKSRAVPDLARRLRGPGKWSYSSKLIDDLRDYLQQFPELGDALIKAGPSVDRPVLNALPVDAIKGWLKDRGYPIGSESALPCDHVEILDRQGVEEIAKSLDAAILKSALSSDDVRRLSPCQPTRLLTRSTAQLYAINNNVIERARFSVGDRVIWCGDGADGIPFGALGTVISVFGDQNEEISGGGGDPLLWLLMDKTLRGVASDLGGYLPTALKHRGLPAPLNKVIKLSPGDKKSKNSLVISSAKVNAKVLKFNNAAESVKLREKSGNQVQKSGNQIPSINNFNSKPNAVELLQNLFQAASLEGKQTETKEKVVEKVVEMDIKNYLNDPIKAIKKKPANTSGTAKISYSTKTKNIISKE